MSIVSIMNIIAGLILITGLIAMIPAVGKSIAKYTKAMAAYQVPIGIIALILGILGLLNIVSGGLIPSIIAILAGIFLAISVVGALPKVGESMVKIAKAIGGVQVIFGIITLIVGLIM